MLSVKINMKTPRKKELADVMRSLAAQLETSSNDTITIDLELIYDVEKKEKKQT